MSNDAERIAVLERDVNDLMGRVSDDAIVISQLQTKVNNAESYGRGFLYAMLMVGGVLAGLDHIKELVKRFLT
jgi:hypothetical protein